ncbi:MAG: glycerol-3-phosphate dehydrogenase [Cyanobacteria bacterium P01_H01_bin.15]
MDRNFPHVQEQAYDLIVIGGGVNGAATARDAALRGLKTILIEKNDFASGTSSWSTRLIHGGLRYLEYFEIPLVRESLREREILFKTAPHLVKPLLLTIPIYKNRSRPYWKIWAGMCLYDLLSLDKTVPLHRMLPKAQFKQLFRGVDIDGLAGGAQYYDGQVVLAERLCWENILDAKRAGATVLNYVKVQHLHRSDDRISHLSCRDELTGADFTVRGTAQAIVINTSGPWVDHVCQTAQTEDQAHPIGEQKKIGGTKGSHIVVEPFPGAPLNTSFYVEAKSDGRPFFIVPWAGKYLIGTTDLPYSGDLDQVKADDAEIDYLLRETNLIIPGANLCRKDVIFTYSGVRPLPNSEGKKPGSITRKHILFDHQSEGVNNLISLIGGKLTTYRHVGEEMVNRVFRKRRQSVPVCPTLKRPLPGYLPPQDAQVELAIAKFQSKLDERKIRQLFEVYGLQTMEILKLIDESPELADPLMPGRTELKAQIVYAVQSEMAEQITDILRRRTIAGMTANYGLDTLPVIVELLIRYCGWSQARCDESMAKYHQYLQENCLPEYSATPELVA